MRSKPLEEYDLDALERYVGQAAKADKTFSESHFALYQADSSVSEEQYHDEDEEHQVAMDAFRKMSTQIKACVCARSVGDRLKIALQDLQGNLSAGYTPGMAPQYSKIERDLDDFRDLVSKDGVSKHAEMAERRQQVMQQWYQVDKAHTDAGYLPATTATGGAPPSTTLAHSQTTQVLGKGH